MSSQQDEIGIGALGDLRRRQPRQVVVAVQGVLISRSVEPGGEARACPSFVWGLLDSDLETALSSRTIADLCREAARRGVDRAAVEPAMYHI